MMNNLLLKATRLWLPLGIAAAGVACIIVGGDRPAGRTHSGSVLSAAGVALLLVALIVWMINWMYRLSIQSNRERDREEEARQYFEEHGRWPGE